MLARLRERPPAREGASTLIQYGLLVVAAMALLVLVGVALASYVSHGALSPPASVTTRLVAADW